MQPLIPLLGVALLTALSQHPRHNVAALQTTPEAFSTIPLPIHLSNPPPPTPATSSQHSLFLAHTTPLNTLISHLDVRSGRTTWTYALPNNVSVHALTTRHDSLFLAGSLRVARNRTAVFAFALHAHRGTPVWNAPLILHAPGENVALAAHATSCLTRSKCLFLTGHSTAKLSATSLPPNASASSRFNSEQHAFIAVVNAHTGHPLRLLHPTLPRFSQGVSLSSAHHTLYLAINSFSASPSDAPRASILAINTANLSSTVLTDHSTPRLTRIHTLVPHPISNLYVVASVQQQKSNSQRYVMRSYSHGAHNTLSTNWNFNISTVSTAMHDNVPVITRSTNSPFIYLSSLNTSLYTSKTHPPLLTQSLSLLSHNGTSHITWYKTFPQSTQERVTHLHLTPQHTLVYAGSIRLNNNTHAMYGTFGSRLFEESLLQQQQQQQALVSNPISHHSSSSQSMVANSSNASSSAAPVALLVVAALAGAACVVSAVALFLFSRRSPRARNRIVIDERTPLTLPRAISGGPPLQMPHPPGGSSLPV
ncbi:hypothetical protein BWQ96_08331 [Gracilariopsis chorda]|uniref:Uncharacterized protein n=1 Tax=Gracilariopsis chorda TaxID=448386 RepID=A0A2V3IIQ2_9FLOR|nr:hypothetical protein BWQ96_08331 [Gracilariopsis chorda]|eukprot:PXF41951.1 hypothetical protein BWQ96_08331 [Gracilariopsis chorda]